MKGAHFIDVQFVSSDMSLVQVGDVTCPGACRSTGHQHPSTCTLSRVWACRITDDSPGRIDGGFAVHCDRSDLILV